MTPRQQSSPAAKLLASRSSTTAISEGKQVLQPSAAFPTQDPPATSAETSSLRKLKTSLKSRLDSDERTRKVSDKENSRNVLRKPRKDDERHRSPSIVDSITSTTAERTLVGEDVEEQVDVEVQGKSAQEEAEPAAMAELAEGTPEDSQPISKPKKTLPTLRLPILNLSLDPPDFITSAAGPEPSLYNLASRLTLLPLHTAFAIAGRLPIVGPYAPHSSLEAKEGHGVLVGAAQTGTALVCAGYWQVASWFVAVKA